jgi:hypothetical protein
MEQSYRWYDGYVFLHSKRSWLGVCGLWSDGTARYAGRLEHDDGEDPDRIIVFVEVDKDEKDAGRKLDEKIKKVTDKANPSFATAKSTAVGTAAPTRWSEKKPWGVFLRITATRGHKRALFDSLYPDTNGGMVPADNYYGHALCDGDWDVLLELGAESKRALVPLVEMVQGMNGVGSTIVNRQQNYITKPAPPKAGECREWKEDDPTAM